MSIHPSAFIEDGAKISNKASIGAFCTVGKDVTIEDDVVIGSHVALDGFTTIGQGTHIYPFCSVGLAPQDLKYNNEPTKLIIGKNNRIREACIIHVGTVQDKGQTIIGDNNLLMGEVHIAHDCVIGNNVIIAHASKLAGHVSIDDKAIVGGGSVFHQFSRVGKHCFIAGASIVHTDAPPYSMFVGTRTESIINGVNLIGMRRSGFSNQEIKEVARVLKKIFSHDALTKDSLAEIKDSEGYTQFDSVRNIILFMEDENSRGCIAKYRS